MKQTTEQLKDLLAKVTPGEWEINNIYAIQRLACHGISGGKGRIADVLSRVPNHTEAEQEANAHLMVIAPTLAREVIELREAKRELVEAVNQAVLSLSAFTPKESQKNPDGCFNYIMGGDGLDCNCEICRLRKALAKHGGCQ